MGIEIKFPKPMKSEGSSKISQRSNMLMAILTSQQSTDIVVSLALGRVLRDKVGKDTSQTRHC
jgi:hypothetical protein